MRYVVLHTCTPSVAQHTLRGIADEIERRSEEGYELINILTSKDLADPFGRLQIILIYEMEDETWENKKET